MKTNKMRKADILPGIVYGYEIKNTPVAIGFADLERLLKSEDAGRLFNLSIEGGETFPVLLKDLQRDPLSGFPIHVDFHKVRTDEKIEAEVELKFIGEAPAVKNLSGILLHNLDRLNVSCLPADLVSLIEVDVSTIEELEKPIRVKDLNIPKGLTVLDNPEEVVATVIVQKEEKEEVADEAEKIAKIAGIGAEEETQDEKEQTNKDSGKEKEKKEE